MRTDKHTAAASCPVSFDRLRDVARLLRLCSASFGEPNRHDVCAAVVCAREGMRAWFDQVGELPMSAMEGTEEPLDEAYAAWGALLLVEAALQDKVRLDGHGIVDDPIVCTLTVIAKSFEHAVAGANRVTRAVRAMEVA